MILVAVLVLLLAADVVTTRIGLARGATEANPVVAHLIGRLGLWPGLLLPKAALLVLVAAFTLISPAPAGSLAVLALIYGAVVAWNVSVLVRTLH